MKTLVAALCLTVSVLGQVNGGQRYSPDNKQSVTEPTVRPAAKGIGQDWEQRERDFARGREMLEEAKVPFNPRVLLRSDWRQSLRPVFERMPEMKRITYETEPLNGLYLADTIYLPEKVELKGDTVLLVRHLIFEGLNAVIKGNHNIYVYPVETAGVMGMTLEDWRRENGKGSLSPRVDEQGRSFPAQPLARKRGHITIDTHGDGYKEWLESIGGPKGLKEYLRRVQTRELQVVIDTHGKAGAMGIPGDSGNRGPDGVPSIGGPGTPGTCGSSATVNGGIGQGGGDGQTGTRGGDAGNGHPGDSGRLITFDIPEGSLDTYTFLSYGGDGGPGGPAGAGGQGGTGGNGGPGGPGATCNCALGGAGNGGEGGPAGWGGKGGPGGTGGNGNNGGNAGDITVTYPCGFDVSKIVVDSHGGSVGGSGQQGAAGVPGLIGARGDGGAAGSTRDCSSSTPHAGPKGTEGSTFGFGNPGDPGLPGTTPGTGGAVSITQRACSPPPGFCEPTGEVSGTRFGCYWDPLLCQWECSPVIIDVRGDGMSLTDISHGVLFDLNSDGVTDSMAWTAQGSDDAFLVLDRNANGIIDNGMEMFGSFTPQPASNQQNGFIALAEFDKPENGGNRDGVIDDRDRVFSSLRLWQDLNHNGYSEAGELHTLPSLGVVEISLDFKESRRRDEFGNWFRYRAKVKSAKDSDVARWAWDVFLLSPQ